MGVYCGRLLADLGADVIRVEPPGGDASRRLGPFYQDEPGPERSLFHWHFNASKRGITLDLTTRDGQVLFKRLAATADVVVETFQPGYLHGLGIGYEALCGEHTGIIVTSITPFGQTGPYSQYQGEELIGQAAGGLLWMCGWPDRPPVMMGGWPALHQASTQGAAGTLIALEFRDQTGEGQHVDVSMQASLPLSLMASMPEYHRLGVLRQPRVGDFHGSALNGMFACSDGYADFRFRGRPGQWERIVEWMADMADDLGEERYRDPAYRRKPDVYSHIDEVFQRFIVRFSREEAMDTAQRQGIEVGAVYTVEDMLRDPQLQARHFFVHVEHDELGRSFIYPGPPFVLAETPSRISRRAPLLGEHNAEIYIDELGLSRADLASLRTAGTV
jgi:crotonobetainyl-CoA:carnitine CoA-transferase CaiB-like acyl-CoA transferase